MASLVCIEDCIRHNDKWRVQRDNGSNYRIFDSFEEAQIYYDYLQTLDNQEKALSQNQKIIENQNRILEQNKGLRTAPRIQQVRQVLDPEYEEWLRYKKETDPAYQKWKKEKDAEKAKINAERAKRNEELEKIRAARIRKEQESHYRSQISYGKAVLSKHLLIIDTYMKWWPIIEKISQAGVGPVAINFHGGGREYNDLPYFVKRFLEFRTETAGYGLEGWKRKCQELKDLQNRSYSSLETECSYWESGISALERYHKSLQWLIAYEIFNDYRRRYEREGLRKYLEIVINNLKQAKNYRQWGIFSDVRRRDREYWKKYKNLYTVLEPHLNTWYKDMDILYYRSYDEEE